ncbi:MAG TPA: ABC-type transport auxiliary lipoprotein family protein [Solimonas sp.]|nr:ABC-type transport auxiliary lipoprotein family protein [Solimonas sp.]
MTRIKLALPLALLLSACAATPPVPDVYYRLDLPDVARLGSLERSIVVEPVRAQGVYAERPLLYANGSTLRQYAHHFWAEPPALALQGALMEALRGAGATQVRSADLRTVGDLVIRSRLRRMELVTDTAEPRALLAIDFTVSDRSGAVLLSQQFEKTRHLDEAAPEPYVEAVAALAADACTALAQALWARPAN